jgi:hypothetical protein
MIGRSGSPPRGASPDPAAAYLEIAQCDESFLDRLPAKARSVTMVLWSALPQLGQFPLKGSSEPAALPDYDAAPVSPSLSSRCTFRSVSSQQVVRPGAGLIQILEHPGVGFSASRGGSVRESTKDTDARFAGAVVLRPGAG